jgi:hypothetical protein
LTGLPAGIVRCHLFPDHSCCQSRWAESGLTRQAKNYTTGLSCSELSCNLKAAGKVDWGTVHSLSTSGDIVPQHSWVRISDFCGEALYNSWFRIWKLNLARLGLQFVAKNIPGLDVGEKPLTTVRNALLQYAEQQFVTEFVAKTCDANATKLMVLLIPSLPPIFVWQMPSKSPSENFALLYTTKEGTTGEPLQYWRQETGVLTSTWANEKMGCSIWTGRSCFISRRYGPFLFLTFWITHLIVPSFLVSNHHFKCWRIVLELLQRTPSYFQARSSQITSESRKKVSCCFFRLQNMTVVHLCFQGYILIISYPSIWIILVWTLRGCTSSILIFNCSSILTYLKDHLHSAIAKSILLRVWMVDSTRYSTQNPAIFQMSCF